MFNWRVRCRRKPFIDSAMSYHMKPNVKSKEFLIGEIYGLYLLMDAMKKRQYGNSAGIRDLYKAMFKRMVKLKHFMSIEYKAQYPLEHPELTGDFDA